MDLVSAHFDKTYAKTGVALTGVQLLEWARGQKQRVNRSDVYAFLRERESGPSGKFSKALKRPRHTQRLSVPRSGVYFIDYGEFHKEWQHSNNGATGFLVAVENCTNRLFALPTRGKDTSQWLNSIARFVETVRQVSVIYSDRDSVAQSAKFRERLESDYGIRWHFLRKGNKSFLAERYVGFVKTKLSQALESSGEGSKRWIDFLPALVDTYNKSKVPGTSYTRQAVSRENFSHFLSQLFGSRDYENRFSAFAVAPFDNRPSWNKSLFAFDLGDRVRVARKADWTDPSNRSGFKRASILGSYGDRTYVISGRQLRAASGSTPRYTAVYQLDGISSHPSDKANKGGGGGDGSFQFYESELVRVGPTAKSSKES